MILLSVFIPCQGYSKTTFDLPIKDIFVLSDIDAKKIEIRLWIQESPSQEAVSADLFLLYPDDKTQKLKDLPLERAMHDEYVFVVVDIDPVITWHPDHPRLYTLSLFLKEPGGKAIAYARYSFGMRKLESKNGKFYVNNAPFYVRAYGGEGGCGCDDLSPGEIRKRLSQARKFGFNTVRHHTHIPTDEYQDIADEVGIFIQMEIGGKQIGNDPESETFLEWRDKWIDMIRQGRRHPSSFIYSPGNELYLVNPGLLEILDTLHDIAKDMDPGTFFLNRSGSNPFNDAYGKFDLIERPIGEYEHTAEFAREAFEMYLRGDRKGRTDEFPIIAHEYPLVASYPNPALLHKYDETPEWIATTIEQAEKNDLAHLLPIYVKNTEKIQALVRKEMLEEARKFPELDGYSMLRFTDCGNYVSGVVDDFSDPKNVSMEEFLQTNGETVLLCTWPQDSYRAFHFGDEFEALIEISHHGPESYSASSCQWQLMQGARVLAEGEFKDIRVESVDVAKVGNVKCTIPKLDKASKLTLRAVLQDTNPRIYNEWYFWAFPEKKISEEGQKQFVLWDPRERLGVYPEYYPGMEYITDKEWQTPEDVNRIILTDSWNDSFYDFLDNGGRICVISDKTWPWPEEIGIFGLHITRINPEDQSPPVFPELDEKLTNWLTICSNNPKRYGNSGTVIYPHPLMENFPHERFCDMHFWPMIYRAKSLRLADFPEGVHPVIRAIDNYYRGDSKGYVVEMKAGEGHIFISTLNFTQSFPWAKQTRYMFNELLRYLTSEEFQPEVSIPTTGLKKMIDDFAEELKDNPPPVLSEMPARYETLWKKRLSTTEFIVLPVYQAKGADDSRMGVHYEYAQTRFFMNLAPGDDLAWEFENETDGDFNLILTMATPLKGVKFVIKIDDRSKREVELPVTPKWQEFESIEVQILDLKPGTHDLKLTVSKSAPVEEGKSVQLQDVEMKAVDE